MNAAFTREKSRPMRGHWHAWLWPVLTLAAVGCGSASHGDSSTDADGGSSGSSGTSGTSGSSGTSGTGSSGTSGASGSSGSSGVDPGAPITCATPGAYKKNGGACGSERWDVKTGTDTAASKVSLVPTNTTIAALIAVPSAKPTARESPTETTLWELKDVTLTTLKLESDSDYHLVISDGASSMIAEIPYPTCATASKWSCFITNARSVVDAKFTVSTSPQHPAQTVTVRGVGFFDFAHGQTGEAPNSIELHAVLQICFGKGCTPS